MPAEWIDLPLYRGAAARKIGSGAPSGVTLTSTIAKVSVTHPQAIHSVQLHEPIGLPIRRDEGNQSRNERLDVAGHGTQIDDDSPELCHPGQLLRSMRLDTVHRGSNTPTPNALLINRAFA